MNPNRLFKYPTREHLKTPQGPADHIYMELKYGGRGQQLRDNLYNDLHNIYGGSELTKSLMVYAEAYSEMLAVARGVDTELASNQEIDRNEASFYTGSLVGVRAYTTDLDSDTRFQVLSSICSDIVFDENQERLTVPSDELTSWSVMAGDSFMDKDPAIRRAVNRVTNAAYEDYDPLRRGVYTSLFASGFVYAADQVTEIRRGVS